MVFSLRYDRQTTSPCTIEAQDEVDSVTLTNSRYGIIPAYDSAVFSTGTHITVPDMCKHTPHLSGVRKAPGVYIHGYIDKSRDNEIMAVVENRTNKEYIVYVNDTLVYLDAIPLENTWMQRKKTSARLAWKRFQAKNFWRSIIALKEWVAKKCQRKEDTPINTMRVVLEEGAIAPTRSHETDAGLDLYALKDGVVPAHGSAVFDTGTHMELPKGSGGLLVSRSGLNIKNSITSTGLIDEGYTGTIKAKLYNDSDMDYSVHAGDRITQILIIPVIHVDPVVVDSFEETEISGEASDKRGENGFASTGR